MGWLNGFSVFTAGLPPGAHFNLSNNKKVDRRVGDSQRMDAFFIEWLDLGASMEQYLFIERAFIYGDIPLNSDPWIQSRGMWLCRTAFLHPLISSVSVPSPPLVNMSAVPASTLSHCLSHSVLQR